VQVYACGLNNYGQLGTGDKENHAQPTLVPKLTDVGVIDIQGGEHHTMVLTNTGRVYMMGRGDQGQLGMIGVSGDKIGVGESFTEPVMMPPSRFGGDCKCIACAYAGVGVGAGVCDWGRVCL
jgi:hypothetical protein